MYVKVIKPLTFEEFLAWDDGSDRDFELLDGVPVPLSEPNANHEDLIERLCTYLGATCLEADLPYVSRHWKDDYLTKLAEYEDLGVSEYIIVDYAAYGGIRFIGSPKQPTITIYQLENGEYLPGKIFRGSDRIESRLFPNLTLTAEQIFAMSK